KKSPELLPTRSNIEARIKQIVEKCRRQDTILIALTGHGLQFTGNKDAFFCPIDARPFASETKTLVSVSGIYEELEKSFAGVKVILVDACRNDPDPGRGRGLDADSAPPPPKGVAALFSCSAGQRAFEHDEFQHGIFFHHVLEGLGGEAANRDGNVTFDSLSAYVRGEVPKSMQRLLPGQEQFPNLKADLVGVPPVLATINVAKISEPSPAASDKPKMQKPTPAKPPTGTQPGLAIAPFDAATARKHQEAWARYMGTEVEITNSIGMKLTLIPPGEFMMGSEKPEARSDEKPVHPVRLTKPFFLGTTEVTRREWELLMGPSPWGGPIFPKGKEEFANLRKEFLGGPTEFVKERENYPINLVSHDDVVEFCRRLSEKEGKEYRLPTEAEWENACRAGTNSSYYFGDTESDLDKYAWHLKNAGVLGIGGEYAHQVGLKKANQFGLFDMHGNLSEWCSDWYDEEYYSKFHQENPQGASSGLHRVSRGGSWKSDPKHCRTAHRDRFMPSEEFRELGFRLALVP
ncbi:MAG: SUMF1/EgtB/PvdO family nonheme iron enzyme, partial [Planctomycetaceae bacterium]|nr:SUMF1/EgtB/PvdO family nonheme iron enzyme [Planctomycetaceae bacterium]